MQERRTRAATPADFHRLADLAHERGLRLFRDGPRWFCSSASDAGASHYVTGFSCDCPGFISHQRCTHHALLLERLGWLPELEATWEIPKLVATSEIGKLESTGESPQLEPVDCPECCGCGLQDFGRYALPCETCGGSGVKPDRRLRDFPETPEVQPAVEIVATAA